ncbi:MAG: type II secretion system minor pseudopilin GspI [Congregibacter sp.]
MSRSNTGFTLVEVMVALMIVALTLPALLFGLDQQIDGTAYLRDRSMAQMVASNRMSELRLLLGPGGRSLTGRLAGSEDLAGRTWYWSVQTQTTEVPNYSRVEVRVQALEEDDAPALATLVAYLAVGLNGESGLTKVDVQRSVGPQSADVTDHG